MNDINIIYKWYGCKMFEFYVNICIYINACTYFFLKKIVYDTKVYVDMYIYFIYVYIVYTLIY